MYRVFVLFFCLAGAIPCLAQPAPWYPDLYFDAQAPLDNIVDTNVRPGRWIFRFRTSLPNVGLGPFVLEAVGAQDAQQTRNMVQRVFNDDGSSATTDAGNLRHNDVTQMVAGTGWSEYRLRVVLPDDGVGPIVSYGGKPQVRITSSALYDNTIPNVPPSGQRIVAGNGRHGISVGYTDIYTKTLEDQWIDFTGLCPGEYWLELEINRGRHVMESNYENNITRLKITLPDQGLPSCLGNGGVDPQHSADITPDSHLTLNELLRVIQFFNIGAFSCGAGSEDGFLTGPGNMDCTPHSSDYINQDWRIELGELLRLVQFLNVDGMYICPEAQTDDGFCAFPVP